MTPSERKLGQYLAEARASEDALIRVLQSQIAMAPRGSYRSLLEEHLQETREHSERVGGRLAELGDGSNPLTGVIGFWESLIGQTLALSKTPLDLLRGASGEEKILKNAKDACATEALEIATYKAIDRLASSRGDQETAKLAASILSDEERMLERLLREIPALTDAVSGAELEGHSTYDLATTGAADAVREAGQASKEFARKASKQTVRQARKVPGVAQVEGQLEGAVAAEQDLAIAGYDGLTADEITGKLPELSQIELAKIDSYERRHQNRTTVLSRIESLRGQEPWAGYDELTAAEVQAALSEADQQRVEDTRSYERAHKNRATVLKATERVLSDV